MQSNKIKPRAGWGIAPGALLGAALALGASPAAAQTAPAVKLGIVTFLSGPAAGPFGIPARNAAELVTEAINKGDLPAPYNSKGLAGASIETLFVDEAGPASKVVQDFRDLVERRGVDAVVGYVSSGSCLGIAPVAEELKKLTVFFDCGTPRIFEDASYHYVFRPSATATIDSIGAARYALAEFPKLKSYAGLNQNYAWGQDSWGDFDNTMKVLKPGLQVTTVQFPKLFSGQYSAEISALLANKADLIHSSFYDGDLESFILQAAPRDVFAQSKVVFTTGETILYRFGNKLPDGVIIGARGPYGPFASPGPLNDWFGKAFTDRYQTPPTYPSYQMANSLLGLKAAYEKAAKGKAAPDQEAVIHAFEHLKFQGIGTTVDMALGKGHQGITEIAYGMYKFDTKTGQPTLTNVVHYPAACVNPPDGVKSAEWIKNGMPDAKCP
ncbi:MAG TPA: ABC transporter substrate-binding protein [Stellaceae bacterium]|nr:ABC transporter substrate-binding protein [Stellaceae bacterium]